MPVRKIKPGYCNLTAKVPSKKIQRMVDAESSLERDFIFLLEHDSNVRSFEEQPIKINVGCRTYTPDILVSYNDGEKYLYEVKYRSELKKNWFKLKPKFKASIAFCKQENIKFKIVTDKEIRTPLLKNLEFLSHFSRTISPLETTTSQILIDALISLRKSSPKELLAACFCCKINRAQAAPVLWRLIANGSVHIDLSSPLTMYSTISISRDIWEAIV
ncbi:heteromeric transposase endonuclease subunit TnsA [Vibrio cholerae]|uniref:heteromeric transposase endonuclease subunit TnsA n=1 Tax=Vibrio cholerae TaxID=666 RepID=UPI0004E3F60C|nr:heteromeric transposase endonuclease subunit TnsA [Vibrio cholerae]EKB5073017.1 heteromeric transposase endonuclease subunit TnsA [Vibrio cholerae]KFE19302.1 hypothetical protein DN39_2331 [Vibrio cholerae]TXZ44667.1 heteromeric transposase endonuclease subunit TnsA [Vibrio cholerae]GHX66498.1 heteromeric transposase endonuclease subunit TnsA [Vibrio cholerae]GHZ83564.1 heteromeric transposase endonuclease subunit TnsA [Vibrio cholerae]